MVQSITLQNVADTAIVNNDILGQICFAAPNESSGTDSILISASIFARSEGTFAADNNATELVFTTAATESAAPGATNYDMTLSSAGVLTLTGAIELGHASDTTLARASSGDLNVEGNLIYRAGGTDVPVADGGTGVSTLTDGGILLGSGTGAITALAVLGDGVIVVGDNSTDPTTITAFTASDGVLKHEVGGLELDISGIAIGDVIAGTGTGAAGIVTSTGHADGQVLTLQADGTADWEAASGGGGSGDVSAGSNFTTAGVIMAAHGDDKTIDEPNTLLTTGGEAMLVSSANTTSFAVDGADGDGNCAWTFTAGTGGAGNNNQASIKVIAESSANANIYLGDATLPTIGGIKYKNSNDSMQLVTNNAIAVAIDSDKIVDFKSGVIDNSAENYNAGTNVLKIKVGGTDYWLALLEEGGGM